MKKLLLFAIITVLSQISFAAQFVEVNDLTDLNYKSKEEIYKLRKDFVKKSIFNNSSYEPNEHVFGQIEGNKPWLGIKAFSYQWNKETLTEGVSEESRFINNPSALVMINMPYNNVMLGKIFNRDLHLLPNAIFYSKENKTITIVYNFKNFRNEMRPEYKKADLFCLDGVNARDFGYEWVCVYDIKNISFKSNHIKERPYDFKNFIHLGGSAGIPGGCNNGSPYQPELNFAINALPAHMNLKLWKSKPSSISQKPDMIVELILE